MLSLRQRYSNATVALPYKLSLLGVMEERERIKKQIDPEGLSQGADLLLRWGIKHRVEVMPS